MSKTTNEKHAWNLLRNADLKVEMEGLLSAAQEQVTGTNYGKHEIYKTAQLPFCTMCDTKSETISYIKGECGKLTQKE